MPQIGGLGKERQRGFEGGRNISSKRHKAVGVRARENFPGRRERKGWFFTRATFDKTVSMGHPLSFFEPLLEQCLGRQARKSSGLDKKKKKKEISKTKWKEGKRIGFFELTKQVFVLIS